MEKSVFFASNVLHNQGFATRITQAYELAKDYDIDIGRRH